MEALLFDMITVGFGLLSISLLLGFIDDQFTGAAFGTQDCAVCCLGWYLGRYWLTLALLASQRG